MQLISISAITIPSDRQRKEGKDSKSLQDFKADLLKIGLMHPILLTDSHQLVAGERRLLAITELHQDGFQIRHNGDLVPPGMIPFTRFVEADDIALLEAEFSENFWRLNLTWQEETEARVRIHNLRNKIDPSNTQTQTAVAILEKKDQPITPAAINSERKVLSQMLTVQAHMANPNVAKAPSLSKAYKAVLESEEVRLGRELARLDLPKSNHTLLEGDFITLASTLQKGSFDLIFSDPPYGINAHQNAAAAEHRYDDSPEAALKLYKFIIQLGFDLLKPQGAVILFCDIDHFKELRTFAEQHAFSTWRTPLVWYKGTEGHAPWGHDGFKRCFELMLYMVKGQRPLAAMGGPDVINLPRNTTDAKVHGAEKPPELLRYLLQKTCRPLDRVLDPCCGSGSIFLAAKGMNLHVTGCEKSPEYHGRAALRLANLEDEPTPETGLVPKPDLHDLIGSYLSPQS